MEANNQEKFEEDIDFSLTIGEGPSAPTDLKSKYGKSEDKEQKDKELKEIMAKGGIEKAKKLMAVMKALTAMKLTKEDQTPGQVIDGLFIGSVGAAYNQKSLQALGITHILTCAANIKPRFENDFKYEVLNCLDSPNQNILTFVAQANIFINSALNNEGKVLVHCFAGKSRATSFTLGYLIKEKKISLKEGLELIWKVRPIAAPNPGFMIQLKALEKDTLGQLSEVEVLQGMWKEKVEEIKKRKQDKADAEQVDTALQQLLKEEVKGEDADLSSQKEVNDALQQISQK